MSSQHNKDNPEDLPWLGRKLLFLDKPKNVTLIVYGLHALCALLFLADFFYKKKYYVSAEGIPGFYALYGFIMCVGLVLGARTMRIFLMRDEDYYGSTDVQSEEFPEDQIERDDHV